MIERLFSINNFPAGLKQSCHILHWLISCTHTQAEPHLHIRERQKKSWTFRDFADHPHRSMIFHCPQESLFSAQRIPYSDPLFCAAQRKTESCLVDQVYRLPGLD